MEAEKKTVTRYNPNTRRYEGRAVETKAGTGARQDRAAVKSGMGGLAALARKKGKTSDIPEQKPGESARDYARRVAAHNREQRAKEQRRAAMKDEDEDEKE